MSSDQQYPYDPQYAPYPQHPQHPQHPDAQPYGDQWAGHDAGGHDGAQAAQTWQGQTWDTQYQPVVGQAQPQPQAPGSPDAGAGAGETAYLAPVPQFSQENPPVTGSHPLPPEVPYPPYEAQPQAQAQAQAQAAYAAAPAPAPAAAGEAGPAYSAPTVSGNSRITDAQRARAEGRSPIIEPGMQPAALTAVLGVLLAGGAAVGTYALLVPLVLLQAVTAAGWFRLNGMWPARQGIALAFLGGVAADVALLAVGREHAAGAIIGTLGVWVLLTLVLQLRSQADPDERMYGLMATVVSAALAVLAAGHLGAERDAVVAGSLAVAAAVLARALPLPGPASVVVSLLAAGGGGLLAGTLTDLGTSGALLGLGAGLCALIGLRAASYDYPSRFVHMTAGVALPLTAAVPAVYLLGRVLA